jgi:protein-S-isoprenylcysteine O-methyltransferase Ste14
MRALKQNIFFFRGYGQGLFFFGLVIYVWMVPPSEAFDGTWTDTVIDVLAVVSLILGELTRIWATSHAGKHTRSRRIKAEQLVTSGPYAYIRNPIYMGNFFIGLGMVLIAEAFALLPVFVAFFALQYRAIVATEENFLNERFGAAYDRYRGAVPRWIPKFGPLNTRISLGRNFPVKEIGTAWGIVVGLFFFEWIESPLHRLWLIGLWKLLQGIAH